jgi:putative GTP pyrophosphokinase
MTETQSIADSIKWYSENKIVYEQLSKKVESIIQEILIDQKIPIHAIYSRAKEIDSFSKKIEDTKYNNPILQITDLSGIRIIAYVESDLDKISKIIEDHFEIDKENSIDKSKSLGTDKVGYRSIHFIGKLPNDRIKLPEYKKFGDLCFEIQIRTILQHSWAEIEHDKNYKFSGELPNYLKRRFKVLAGVLELADREFNQIAFEIDKYSASVNADTKKGKLDINIDSTSIKSYLDIKFKELIANGLNPEFLGENKEQKILIELKDFGITTLKELDNIIPSDFLNKGINQYLQNTTRNNYTGLLRHLMLINDAEKYFKESWKGNWVGIDSKNVQTIKTYYPNIEKKLSENNINIKN